MQTLLKKAARVALHSMGGLGVLRHLHRREFGVLMYHSFRDADRPNLEAICTHIERHFEPVSLSAIADAIEGRRQLPPNAVTVTVDDGYRNFFLHGHPVFHRHRIPVALFAVTGFADGRLWLWPDQIEFGIRQTERCSIRAQIGDGEPVEYSLSTPDEKASAASNLTRILKGVSNEWRLRFLSEFGKICGLEIPPEPPPDQAAMTWRELSAAASEGVEIGCHTETHPILSRLADPAALDREIGGAKRELEDKLGFPVRHFCYPNGNAVDINDAAIRCVREAGYSSAVTCTWGLNPTSAEPFSIRRIPFDSTIGFEYGAELLAGLHTGQKE